MNLKSTLILNNNMEIPVLGLGMYLNSSGQTAYNALITALKSGYRHFDTAKFYANETDVGQEIRKIYRANTYPLGPGASVCCYSKIQ